MNRFKRGIGAALVIGTLSFAGVACSSGGGSSSAFCDAAKKADASDVDPSDGKAFADLMEDLEKNAPSDIKGDVSTLADALKSMQEDPTKLPDDATQEKLQKASDNIQKYIEDKCGISASS